MAFFWGAAGAAGAAGFTAQFFRLVEPSGRSRSKVSGRVFDSCGPRPWGPLSRVQLRGGPPLAQLNGAGIGASESFAPGISSVSVKGMGPGTVASVVLVSVISKVHGPTSGQLAGPFFEMTTGPCWKGALGSNGMDAQACWACPPPCAGPPGAGPPGSGSLLLSSNATAALASPASGPKLTTA